MNKNLSSLVPKQSLGTPSSEAPLRVRTAAVREAELRDRRSQALLGNEENAEKTCLSFILHPSSFIL
jgi:hypothetical protein